MRAIFPFLHLPREIRDHIYDLCADWNDAIRILARRNNCSSLCVPPGLPSSASTPTVLLLNHQINAEALQILEKKPLQLNLLEELGAIRFLSELNSFLSIETVLRIPRLQLYYTALFDNNLVDVLGHFHDGEPHPYSTQHIIVTISSDGLDPGERYSDMTNSHVCRKSCPRRGSCWHLNTLVNMVSALCHLER